MHRIARDIYILCIFTTTIRFICLLSLSPEFCMYHTKGFVSYFSFLSEPSHLEIRAQTKLRLKFKFKIKFSFLLLSLKYKSNLLLLYNLLDAGRFFQLFVATVLKCKTRYTYFLFSDYDTISFEQTFFV